MIQTVRSFSSFMIPDAQGVIRLPGFRDVMLVTNF